MIVLGGNGRWLDSAAFKGGAYPSVFQTLGCLLVGAQAYRPVLVSGRPFRAWRVSMIILGRIGRRL